MKTILYMAISINGYIARENGNSEWPSPEDYDGFDLYSKKAENVIIGKTTYEQASKEGIFPFPGRLNIVMTHQKIANKFGDQVLFTDKSPNEILKLLEDKGFTTTFVGGGGHINALFMKEKLIDEIYLDVEPIVFGKGIKLFEDQDFEFNLELLGVKHLNKNTVQLHYKVK